MAEPINLSEIDPLELVDVNTITQNLPPELAASLGTLLTILKAIGIVIIIYIIFLIISSIISIRKTLMIKRTYKLVQEINEKLDKLLHKHKERKSEKEKKEHKEKPKHEKEKEKK